MCQTADTRPRVVLLGRAGPSTNILYHALSDEFRMDPPILEETPSAVVMLRGRLRRLGWATVVGQILFLVVVRPFLELAGRRRVQDILMAAGLSSAPIDAPIIHVRSANDPVVLAAIQESGPIAALVSGTRIISSTVLTKSGVPFINVHAGITPRYRGVHGGYWALVNGEPGACGVTVHFLDPGVDTGPVLAQAAIVPSAQDSFATYPYLQLAAAIPLVRAALRQLANAESLPIGPVPVGPTRLWSHPTLWGYCWSRFAHGVR